MKNLQSWKGDSERNIKISDTELPARALYNMACEARDRAEAQLETVARKLDADRTARLLKAVHDYYYIGHLLLNWSADDAAREADTYIDGWRYHIREHLADDSDEEAYDKFIAALQGEHSTQENQ